MSRYVDLYSFRMTDGYRDSSFFFKHNGVRMVDENLFYPFNRFESFIVMIIKNNVWIMQVVNFILQLLTRRGTHFLFR